jgi:hypothetical protein
MNRSLVGFWGAVLLASMLPPRGAHAANPSNEPPQEIQPKQRATKKSFYGWEILATGGVGGLVTAASVLLPSKPLGSIPATAGFIVGMPAFALGGPIVHWSHNDFTKGLISLGGNIIIPLAGGFAGQAIRCGKSNAPDDCGSRGFLTGLAISAMVVPVVDALVLGWEDVPADDVIARTFRPRAPGGTTHTAGVSFAPTLAFGPRGMVAMGIAGKF